jgi:hypothetical protein
MAKANEQFCRHITNKIQDQLEGLSLKTEDEVLNKHLSSCESCFSLSSSFQSIHQSLAMPPADPPEALHLQIMAGIDKLRRSELLYRRGSLALLGATCLLLGLLFHDSLWLVGATLEAIPAELSDLVRPGELFEGFFDWQLSSDSSLPLALLMLLPLCFLVNVMALRGPKVSHV